MMIKKKVDYRQMSMIDYLPLVVLNNALPVKPLYTTRSREISRKLNKILAKTKKKKRKKERHSSQGERPSKYDNP